MSAIAPRATRIVLGAALAATAFAAQPSDAAPLDACGHGPRREVETLVVELTPAPSLRLGSATPIEVRVRRSGHGSLVGAVQADISIRVVTDGMVSYNSASTDPSGRALMQLTLDDRTEPGTATLIADAWSPKNREHGCIPSVVEHGKAEQESRVARS